MSDNKAPAAGSSPVFTSYSLNFEDVILNRLFPTHESGFYVDVGAGHPRYDNDLFALYDRGWSGINIEPNEQFFELHQQLRPRDRNLCMLLSDAPGEPLTYYQIDGSGLSTCDEIQAKQHAAHGHALQARSVQVGTLACVLGEAGVEHIDILKVDVEGFEEKVLSGNDWERFRPSVVLVEATYPESPERRPTEIAGFMEQRGYRHVLFDGLNDFYLEHSFPEPPGLRLPPNVFDRFVPAQIADLQGQVETLQSHLTVAEKYALSLRARQDEVDRKSATIQADYARALSAAEALATANRKLKQQLQSRANETKRLHAAADQMRSEITGLNRMFEPLHAALEQAKHVGHTRAERIEHLDAELRDAHQRLQATYASRSWKLTRPWRMAGRILRRLKG
ncbi:MAG: FkbM family methyltransferase [Pseudomonadota bacterium]|nr:FkbM family methyltransferase [Pseudomonadota bacterium]